MIIEAAEKRESKRMKNALAIRRKIISSSRALFSEDGYQAVTITRIRQRAGVSISTFYKYFDSKKSILLALLENEREVYEKPIRDSLESSVDDPVAYLTSVVEAMLDPTDDPNVKSLWRETVAVTISLSGDTESSPHIDADNEFYRRQLETALGRLTDLGLLKPNVPIKILVSIVECVVAYGFQNYVCERHESSEYFMAHIKQQISCILRHWLT